MRFDFISGPSTLRDLLSQAPTCPSQSPSHSRAFSVGWDSALSSVLPGHVWPRLPPNGQQQNWKACWGNPQEFESLILRQWVELRK